jgi:very-short-patch-repair endonuclease
MTTPSLQSRELWALVRRQHGVIGYAQLRAHGLTPSAIRHRRRIGRLHEIHKGVYAVGRPELTQHGRWMAAVLAAGAGAALSHRDAGALYDLLPRRRGPIHLSVPGDASRRRKGIAFHQRFGAAKDATTTHDAIPVTTIVQTLVDLAATEPVNRLTRAVNQADKHDLIDPDTLRAALDPYRGHPGVRPLRALLDEASFVLTDSELEDRFLPIARAAGLPRPRKERVNEHRVDFHWPALELVVECDGLRYHRTQQQQAADAARDQDHAAAGTTPLRFTHGQVRHEPQRVQKVLEKVARRLSGS